VVYPIFVRHCFVWSVAFFFFSSRRRHTRSKRDWSSDVCSSDLRAAARFAGACGVLAEFGPRTCTGLAGGLFAWFRTGLAPGFGTAIPACFPTRLPASFRTRLPTSFRSRLPAGLRARFADVGGDQGAAEHPGEDPDRVVP